MVVQDKFSRIARGESISDLGRAFPSEPYIIKPTGSSATRTPLATAFGRGRYLFSENKSGCTNSFDVLYLYHLETWQNKKLTLNVVVSGSDQTMSYRASNDQPFTQQQNLTRLHESASCRSSPNMYNRTETQMGEEKGIEVAFDVPSDILDTFVELHKTSENSRGHSAILTIPTQQDRVASLVLSISRSEAVAKGGKHDLPEIFNSGFPSISAENGLPEIFNPGSPSA